MGETGPLVPILSKSNKFVADHLNCRGHSHFEVKNFSLEYAFSWRGERGIHAWHSNLTIHMKLRKCSKDSDEKHSRASHFHRHIQYPF